MTKILANRWIKAAAFCLCLTPVATLVWRAWEQDLSANPVEFITHATGDWALRFLLITLAVTPARRVFGLPQLAQFRRMLGLFSFFYASVHFLTYLWLDKFFDGSEILADITKRPFITIGFASVMVMLPLALTSTAAWIGRLGARRWQRLHRLVYFSGIAAVIHYYWLVKSDIRLPVSYGAILAVLLASRLFASRIRRSRNATTLTLVEIRRETGDTATLRFLLPENTRLNARPGQFLTFHWTLNGRTLPRSYSLSSSPLRTNYVEFTVKEQGVVSTFLNREALQGLTVEAHGPFGRFYFDEKRDHSLVMFAAGSGITPMMSMLRYIEGVAPDTEVTLFYAFRTERDVIFGEELQRLQEQLPRFRWLAIASRPGSQWRGPRGHLNRTTIEEHLGQVDGQTFFVCGPPAFMRSMEEILISLKVPADKILKERFMIDATLPASLDPSMCNVIFSKSGRQYVCSSADTLLTIAERHGIEVASNCRVGQCGSCATRVLDGDVEMETEEGLDPALRARGYRLLCVGRARGPVTLEA
jgi:ferredoxin-NADP reductase/DMSO/TMAO reductase YedYZ heme-binding membrane subunit